MMEIEKKYLVSKLPDNLREFKFHFIEQGYLCTEPVVRVRRQDDDYYLTYKGAGLMSREEYNLPLNAQSYHHLIQKADGNIITKKRYLIPIGENLTVELDIFEGRFKGLMIAEIEFKSEDEANRFIPLPWFGEDVTFSSKYHNSTLSKMKF